MDAGTIIIVLAIVIILAAVGIILAQKVNAMKTSAEQSSAQAYSTRMNANASVILRLREHGPHRITINSTADMTVEPRVLQSESIAPPQTGDSVRYLNDDAHPDSQERRDLLAIVNHTYQRQGDVEIIRAANKCKTDGLLDPVRWQAAIDYGVMMFGVVSIPRQETKVGAYGTISRLADAINRYETIKPPTPANA